MSPFNSVSDYALAETVLPCVKVKSWHLPTGNNSEGRFLSGYENFDLALYIVIGFVLQIILIAYKHDDDSCELKTLKLL